jgi:hypothetical protein
VKIKKGAWIEILPRFKIQYPMKNQCENNTLATTTYTLFVVFFYKIYTLYCTKKPSKIEGFNII